MIIQRDKPVNDGNKFIIYDVSEEDLEDLENGLRCYLDDWDYGIKLNGKEHQASLDKSRKMADYIKGFLQNNES